LFELRYFKVYIKCVEDTGLPLGLYKRCKLGLVKIKQLAWLALFSVSWKC